jgi:hypothetical protein
MRYAGDLHAIVTHALASRIRRFGESPTFEIALGFGIATAFGVATALGIATTFGMATAFGMDTAFGMVAASIRVRPRGVD